MQDALAEPFRHVSSDHLVASGMLPSWRDPDGPFAWWEQICPRFFADFHRCLPALATAGNDLIVEDFQADTTHGVTSALVESVLTAWRSRTRRMGAMSGSARRPRRRTRADAEQPPA